MTLLAGQNSAGVSGDFAASGATAIWPFVASASGTSALMWCQFKVANPSLSDCRLGIYANPPESSGAPLGVATATGYTGTGLFSAPVAGVSIVSGTTYWLGFWATGEQVDFQGSALAGREDVGANFASPHANDGPMGVAPVIWIEDGAAAPTYPSTYPDFQRKLFPFILGDWRIQGVSRASSGARRLGRRHGPSPMGGHERVIFPRLHPVYETGGPILVDLVPATETDTPVALTDIDKKATLGVTAETDTAQALSADKKVTLVFVAETDSAQGLTNIDKKKTLVFAAETDSPQALSLDTLVTLALAAETDTAQALNVDKKVTLTTTAESDVAQALANIDKKVTLVFASETDTPVALIIDSGGTPIVIDLLHASETDTAVALLVDKIKTLIPATETDTAQALGNIDKKVTFTPTAETDSPQVLNVDKRTTITFASESDLAVALTKKKAVTLISTAETDLAIALGNIDKKITLIPGLEFDTAVAITHNHQGVVTVVYKYRGPVTIGRF